MTQQEKDQVEAAQKDKREFVHLYDAHFEAIHRFLLSRVADRQLAEDLTSDTFMIALENIEKYRYEGKPFRAWLYRIAINEINQHYRKNKREREALVQKWHEVGEAFDGADLELKEKEDKQEVVLHLKQLNEAFHLLKPDEQDVLSLRYFQDLSYNEMADALNTNVNNVGVKLNRALKRLTQLCPQLTP